MNFRLTLIALLIAVGLGAYIWISRGREASNLDKADRASKLVPIEAEDIDRLLISHSGEVIDLLKKPSGWVILRPVEANCDPREIQEFVTLLGEARIEDKVGSGDLPRYGLDAPASRLHIEATGPHAGTYSLQFGRINPLQTLVYVLVGESDEVLLTSSSLLTRSLNTPLGWRDKRMIDVERDKVERMVFRTIRAGSLAVRRDPALGWFTEGPTPWRCDPTEAQSLLIALSSLEAVGVRAENKAEAAKHGLGSGKFVARLEFADGSVAGDVEFGFGVGDASYIAAVPDKPEIFTVDAKIGDMVAEFVARPRDRRMLPAFLPSEIMRIETVALTDTFTLQRASVNRWEVASSNRDLTDFQLDSEKVEALLDDLVTLELADFPEQQPAASFYEPPNIQVKLYGEQALISGLEVGQRQPDGLHTFARGPGEPSVYLVSPASLIQLPLDLQRLGVETDAGPGGS